MREFFRMEDQIITNENPEEVSDSAFEALRRAEQVRINAVAADRTRLEERYGRVWTLLDVTTEFEILQFAAPLIVVKRRSDGALGTFYFQHQPRFYFDFSLDKP
jgi:hypothetical protein